MRQNGDNGTGRKRLTPRSTAVTKRLDTIMRNFGNKRDLRHEIEKSLDAGLKPEQIWSTVRKEMDGAAIFAVSAVMMLRLRHQAREVTILR